MDPIKAEERRRLRADPLKMGQAVERLLPEPKFRRYVIDLVARDIERAHRCGASVWVVTLADDLSHLRLTVGRALIIGVHQRHVWLSFWRARLSAKELLELDSVMLRHQPWSTREATVEHGEVTHAGLSTLMEVVRPAHEHFVDVAGREVVQTPSAYGYSPGVVDYLERELGRKLPRASYAPPGGRRR